MNLVGKNYISISFDPYLLDLVHLFGVFLWRNIELETERVLIMYDIQSDTGFRSRVQLTYISETIIPGLCT